MGCVIVIRKTRAVTVIRFGSIEQMTHHLVGTAWNN
jgi:hypothetical protein